MYREGCSDEQRSNVHLARVMKQWKGLLRSGATRAPHTAERPV
jgi:hypothetical protein